MKRPRRPRDPNQLAKLVVDMATGEAPHAPGRSAKDSRRLLESARERVQQSAKAIGQSQARIQRRGRRKARRAKSG